MQTLIEVAVAPKQTTSSGHNNHRNGTTQLSAIMPKMKRKAIDPIMVSALQEVEYLKPVNLVRHSPRRSSTQETKALVSKLEMRAMF